ncbi:SOS response-associated peptidase family protein [Anaerotardibacter muris]|uniref:SOS response-associated peptidase family protein n=1 Tax=Anaerotardibacter muris TaxID=2941505 RepID=UPI00203AB292|nr:SOS response-associated peptidase family protein [Anaerotardibacter muris]
MCRRMTVIEFDELLGIIHAIEYHTPFNVRPDWPARPRDAFPNDMVPLLIAGTSEDMAVEEFEWNKEMIAAASVDEACIIPARKQWGFEAAGRSQVIFNTRIETASELPLWKDSLEERRCIIPVRAFYETHGTETAISPRSGCTVKQVYRFTDDIGLMLLAGIWKNDRFSVVTTSPNMSVAPVHDRMPLVLSRDNAHAWLMGDWRTVPKTTDISLASAPIYQPQASVDQPRLF